MKELGKQEVALLFNECSVTVASLFSFRIAIGSPCFLTEKP